VSVQKKGTQFVVDFKGVELPLEVQRKISAEIQSVVLRELAQVDLKGDLKAKVNIPSAIRPPFPPTNGIVLEPAVEGFSSA
jgi:hypothetical protein